MEKFLSIPVTSEGNQLVPVTDVKLIEWESQVTTSLTYGSGKVTTITHADVGAASGTNSGNQFRNWLQDQARLALSTSWTNPSYSAIPSYAVSDITIV
jgi:hypothetical protein|tara:strand:+ start:8903 stop:9196 length:294 start_codon:yes stop_codon:yes gene_type:complete